MFRSVRTPHVVAAATFVAFLSAQPYTGSWNDGSRLATVEVLVDYGTLAIDDSVFVRGAPALASADQSRPRLGGTGTLDKMLVGGRFYSDKPPVPALFLAGPYAAWRWSGGPSAVERPDAFCWLMTLCLCGPAYVLAVWGMWSLVRRAAVPGPWDVALTASFALGTIALPYAQHVNQHLPLLAVAVWVVRLMLDPPTAVRAALLGFLAGLGYTLDLGAGPPLLAAAGAWLLWQGRWKAAVIFAAAALPWLALHHAVNFAVGGTFGPANANPEYFRWPGSPFSEANMTGGAVHPNAGKALLYAADLLLGKRGFLLHDMPLLLAVLATPALLLRCFAERPVVVAGGVLGGGDVAAVRGHVEQPVRGVRVDPLVRAAARAGVSRFGRGVARPAGPATLLRRAGRRRRGSERRHDVARAVVQPRRSRLLADLRRHHGRLGRRRLAGPEARPDRPAGRDSGRAAGGVTKSSRLRREEHGK